MRRTLWGVVAAVASTALCTAVLLAFRPHLSVATAALVLVVPVVVGVATGGFAAGATAAAVGFLCYDWFFIPPYGTLTVSSPQDWVALGVYAVVVLVVARLVAVEQAARSTAASREEAIRRLFAVSEGLIRDRPLADLLELVVTTVHESFRTRWVALLLPSEGGLVIAAVAGGPLAEHDRAAALGSTGGTQSMTLSGGDSDVSRVSLTSAQRPVGQLVVAGAALASFERELLGTFANEAALAIEQSQLREQATRTTMLEEVDRWRSALVGAVSHDLRTPLAAIKAAVTTLEDADAVLSDEDHAELLETIEGQTDHLAHLVANLLDMARIESGALVAHPAPCAVTELVAAALRAVGAALARHVVVVDAPEELALVEADEVLIAQVIANLLTNAAHHAPEGSTITIAARERGEDVAITVSDHGPGVAPEDRERLFHMLDRAAGAGRAGLGLAICTAFVEAHGRHLAVGDADGGGAAFSFSLPTASVEEPTA